MDITLEQTVNAFVQQAKDCGDMDPALTVDTVIPDHPTDPTRVIIVMSDESVMTLEIKRPAH